MIWWFLIFFSLLVFYILIPGFGILLSRKSWKDFRSRLVHSTLFPYLAYENLQGKEGAENQCYRFLGTLQAFEGAGKIWLSNINLTVQVDLRGSRVYTLPMDENFDNAGPEILDWNRLSILPQRSSFFVFGPLAKEGRNRLFQKNPENPLLILLYEGPVESIIPRAILHARHQNELWNHLTPLALGAGLVTLLVLSYILISQEGRYFQGLFSLTFALWPLTLFLPPGVSFIFFFRRLWTQGTSYRVLEERIEALRLMFPHPLEEKELGSEIPVLALELLGEKQASSHWVFQEDQSTSKNPDPMKKREILPLSPEKAVVLAQKKTRSFEVLALFIFALGALINGFILLYFLSRIIN